MKLTSKSPLFALLAMSLLVSCSSTGANRRALRPDENRRESLRKQRGSKTSVYVLRGKASYYGEDFHGRRTANGEIYDMYGLTAAHRELPFGTICRITNLKNGKSVIVRINDRGPFVPGRIFDLSYDAAKKLEALDDGIIQVKAEILKLGKDASK